MPYLSVILRIQVKICEFFLLVLRSVNVALLIMMIKAPFFDCASIADFAADVLQRTRNAMDVGQLETHPN